MKFSKLFAILFILMIILSDASSTFRKRLRSKRTKAIPDKIKGFLLGFFMEFSNELPLNDFFTCAFQDIVFNVHDHKLDIISEKMKIEENFDDSDMDEMNDAGAKAKKYIFPKTMLVSRNTEADSTDIFDDLKLFFNNISKTLQTIVDKTPAISARILRALEIFNNRYLVIATDLVGCLLVAGSPNSSVTEANVLDKLASIFQKMYDVYFLISKYYQIKGDITSFIDNINREDVSDYEKYQILGRSIASIMRYVLRLNGFFLVKRLR